jgi:hypothetical protein
MYNIGKLESAMRNIVRATRLAVYLCAVTALATGQEITLSSAEITKEEALARVPLVGFRPVDDSFFVSLTPYSATPGVAQSSFVLPTTWIYDSARATPMALRLSEQFSDPAYSALFSANSQAPYQNTSLPIAQYLDALGSAINDISPSAYPPTLWRPSLGAVTGASVFVSPSGSFAADPVFISTIPLTELVFQRSSGSLVLDKTVLTNFRHVYSDLDWAGQKDEPDPWPYLDDAISRLATAPKLMAVSQFASGNVTFGKPLRRSVPPDWSAVPGERPILVQFAFSLEDADYSQISKVSMRIKTDNRASAVDMLPMYYDAPQPSPTPAGRLALMAVTDGLKPLVVAYGLQESSFWWELTKTAVSAGSHRFLALLSVPNDMKALYLKFTVACKMKDSFLSKGSILVADGPAVEIDIQ